MSMPKKIKYTTVLDPPKVDKFLHYGMAQIDELLNLTDTKTKFLPRTIALEHLDAGVFEYVNSDHMKAVIDGNVVPTFYLDNDRFGEFQKTWKFSDNDKNVPTPYILVRRIEKETGTRLGTKYLVPQQMLFRYMDIPILDEGVIINLRFKMPEPVNVDLTYEVSLFTKYRVDVNYYDELILKNFASRQDYIVVNGSPMPLLLEEFTEANPIENIDGDRFFVAKYNIKLLGFIQDEKNFEITKTTRKTIVDITVAK
jgi:hypothetical protein